MKKFVLGFPRMGIQRELKFAMESFWKGECSADDLFRTGAELRKKHWKIQSDAGLNNVAVGDFSFYDHVLDTAMMLGLIPKRFAHLPLNTEAEQISAYFKMARGDQADGLNSSSLHAMEMTKWFNTNYHYIVPELDAESQPAYRCQKLEKEVHEARNAGFAPRPILLGPITFLAISKGASLTNAQPGETYNVWEKLNSIISVYEEVIRNLAPNCEWIQIDEPILCSDIPEEGKSQFKAVYERLNTAAGNAKILLTTYFDALDDNLPLAISSGCAGLHVDLLRGAQALDSILDALPDEMILSAGLVDGRNIWKNDFQKTIETLQKIQNRLGAERVMLASSCSLLHSPVDLECETALNPTLKNWMAFAVQKCAEIEILADIFDGKERAQELKENILAIQSYQKSPLVHHAETETRAKNVTVEMLRRNNAYPIRREAQKVLNLPILPTTTIGSFPQTQEIRRTRRAFQKGALSEMEYQNAMKNQIRDVIAQQEELGLDVLVHGEAERNDMVEYFGQQLNGFCFTTNGWVQSYGSRCVKPPVIYGDVYRSHPMTIDWITYAQSLTSKPVKGMLTGPITILCWSFIRTDIERSEVAKQIALAVRDEVVDLENAGVRIIQIDEAALSEGMPIKKRDHANYLKWAVEAFRLASSDVQDKTQIHTHMCYSEFNRIIQAIAAMDADVISIESSRSKMELLNSFAKYEYPNEIGPGVYDIHSPRIPSVSEIKELLKIASAVIPLERLWVNPDCGLKTRTWEEVIPSLTNLVTAAKEVRTELQK